MKAAGPSIIINTLVDQVTFFLYEQWHGREAMRAHLGRLIEVYGPPQEGKFLPASPTSFRDDIQVDMYDVVE